MTIHVDSNVLIDLSTDDPDWSDWSEGRLFEYRAAGMACDPCVYAEVSLRFPVQPALDHGLDVLGVVPKPTPRQALFLAAQAHLAYRRRGGLRTATLPDFFVGAHALIEGARLLTRDPVRFSTYFPDLELISP